MSFLRARRVRLGERGRLRVLRVGLRRDGRRLRRSASRTLVAGRTERRIGENTPKCLLVRWSTAGGGPGGGRLAGWGGVHRLASTASVTATWRELVVPCPCARSSPMATSTPSR